ncbi:hypothetical protein MMC16_004489 [Acarospora aff. strigata]|nr:hypothetical protein [Acarospora aff. strigata]
MLDQQLPHVDPTSFDIPDTTMETDHNELPPYSRLPSLNTGRSSEAGSEHAAIIASEKDPRIFEEVREISPIVPLDNEPGHAPESVLTRGLQVPSKFQTVTSGFKYPQLLASCNVSKEQWSVFTNEVKSLAKLDGTQWLTTIGAGAGTWLVGGLLIGWLALVPAAVVGHKMRKHREHDNLLAAAEGGLLATCVQRWNTNYFNSRGLAIRIDLPGQASDMSEMDLSTSRKFKRQLNGKTAPSEKKQQRSERRDQRSRTKAAKKGRIVIIPLNQTTMVAAQEAHRAGGHVTPTSEDELTLYGASVAPGDTHQNEAKPL